MTEHPEAAFSKLEALLEYDVGLVGRLAQSVSQIQEVLKYVELLGVKSKILIAPLGCAKEKICRGGLTFSYQIEGTRELLAAGGRYDSLLSKFAQQDTGESKLTHAVGFGLAWDVLTEKMITFYVDSLERKKGKKTPAPEDDVPGIWRAKRVSHEPTSPSRARFCLKRNGSCQIDELELPSAIHGQMVNGH